MTDRRSLGVGIVVAALLAVVTAAHADPMTFNGMALSRSLMVHDPSLPGGQDVLWAGQQSITYQGEDLWSYCVQVDRVAASMEATEQPITILPNHELVGYLFETFGPQTSNTGAAALQVAIWEAVHETGPTFDVSGGSFFIDPGLMVISQSNAMLSSFPGSYSSGSFVLTNPVYQDVLIFSDGGVPEPITLGLLSVGGVAILRRRGA